MINSTMEFFHTVFERDTCNVTEQQIVDFFFNHIFKRKSLNCSKQEKKLKTNNKIGTKMCFNKLNKE